MNNFGTQNIAVGTPAQFVTGMNWEYLQVSNESGYQLDLNFSGIGSRGFNPWQRDDIAVSRQYTGTLVITASNPGNVDITKFPTSYVQVNAYIPGELTQPMSVALTRLSNIGNPVDSTVTATNAINNTGNGPLSNWLTVMPNDAAANTFTGDTSGNFSVSSDNVGVLTTLIQLIAGASPAVKLAAAAVLTEVLGNLQVDGTADFDSTVQIDGSLLLNSAQGIIKAINSTSGGRVQIQNNNGGVMAQFDSGGLTLGSTTILSFGSNGSASALNFIGVTAPAITYPGSFSVTHNFGFIPQWMIYIPGTRAGTGEGSCTTGVDNYNNTTTCTVTLGAKINGILIGGRCT